MLEKASSYSQVNQQTDNPWNRSKSCGSSGTNVKDIGKKKNPQKFKKQEQEEDEAENKPTKYCRIT